MQNICTIIFKKISCHSSGKGGGKNSGAGGEMFSHNGKMYYLCSMTTPFVARSTGCAEADAAFRELIGIYLSTNHRKRVEKIEKAYRLANEAHKGALSHNGKPYILHAIAVARIVVAELGLGSTSICAALLHDIVERTDYTIDDIEAAAGKKIASIVEGITKISGGIFGDKAITQAENFRKLLLSMSTDIRVVLVKMADRLDNMRHIDGITHEKLRKAAGETLYVYAPLAHRLGLNKIKTELEDLAFRHTHPEEYRSIMEKVSTSEESRRSMVEEFVAPIRRKLDEAGFKYEIKARVKSAWSIWNKMQHKKIPFEEIYDIYAVRVIFENDDDALEKLRCWQIYTFFTEGHRVHPDRLRDWTSTPKANGYRALHVTLMGPQGRWVEVQIRSRKMDEIAELGYAAHWKYKDGESGGVTELDSWMNSIKDILANPNPESVDYLDTIKLNLFSSEIYVFTPKGDLVTLPSGSSVLDFAFEISPELGLHCVAGKLNHKLAHLSHTLESGDQVEIITSDSQHPRPEWLKYCRSAKAVAALRNYLDNVIGMIPGAPATVEASKEGAAVSFIGSVPAEAPSRMVTIAIRGNDRKGLFQSIVACVAADGGAYIRNIAASTASGRFECELQLTDLPGDSPAALCSRLLKIPEVTYAGPPV